MLLFNAHKSSQGFTLIEILVIVAIVGILSAIAGPSFLALLNRNKVNNALTTVQGALQETQREAIKRSTTCTVTLETTNYKVSGNCLLTGDRDLCEKRDLVSAYCLQPKVSMSIPSGNFANGNKIQYSFRGNTANGGTVILSRPDVAEQRCLVTSSGIGIMRTGVYTNSACHTSQQGLQ